MSDNATNELEVLETHGNSDSGSSNKNGNSESGDKKSIDADGLPVSNEVSPDGEQNDANQESKDGDSSKPANYADKFSEPGRVRRFATIMNMLNSLLGAGILSVPASLDYCGIIPSLIILTVVAALSHVSTVMIIKLQARTKADGLDDIALIVTGKTGSFILSILSILFCFSCMIGYLVIGGDIILSWFRLGSINFGSTGSRALLILLYALILPGALTIPKEIKVLSYFSTATVFFILYFVLVIIIKAGIGLPRDGIGKGLSAAKMGMGIFSSFSVYGLAFGLPAISLPIIAPYNKDLHKRSIVSFASILICYFLVIIPGILGYLTLGENCQDNILNSFPDDDTLILTVRIAFFFVVSFSYPCIGQTVISSWAQLIYHKNSQNDLSSFKRYVILAFTNFIPIIIAMFLPKVRPAIGVAGSMGGCAIDFVYPPIMWIILSKQKWSSKQNVLCIIFAVFGVISAVICTYQAIVDAINSF